MSQESRDPQPQSLQAQGLSPRRSPEQDLREPRDGGGGRQVEDDPGRSSRRPGSRSEATSSRSPRRSGRIPDQTVKEIRDRVDIVDFVGRYVELKRAGRSHKGLCPFHGEKTPSFNVSSDRQIYHCFGCGEGGDVISFLIKHENLTFPEAVRTLARECGIEIPEAASGERGVSEGVLTALEVAQACFRDGLAGPEGAGAREYLTRRGLSDDDVARFGLGFVPDRWDTVVGALARKRVPADVGEQAGLLIPRRSGQGHYDRLRGRVVFPIQDARGRVIAFGGRALGADQEPKYLNTPESPVFRKREALYGLPDALEPMRRRERAIVCEGYFDRVALARAGLGESVATCGTALTPDHGKQLRRRTRNVVLLFDGDAAGEKATLRALEVLLPAGLRVRAAALPAGLDPDDFLVERGADALCELVDRAPDALELAIHRAVEAGCTSPAQKANAVAAVAPLVARVQDPVERSEYARRLAVATDSDPRAVESVVREAGRGRDVARAAEDSLGVAAPRRDVAVGEERHLRLLAGVLLRNPALVGEAMRGQLDELLPDGSWKAVLLHLCDAALEGALADDGTVDHFALEERLDAEAWERLRAVAVDDEQDREAAPDAVIEDVLQWFARRRSKVESRQTTHRLRDPSADAAELLAEKQRQLERKRAALGIESGTTR